MIKLSILVAVIVSSGLGVYGYAESVKEEQVKEQLISEQVVLEDSLKKLYDEDFYQFANIQQIKQTLEMYTAKLGIIQGQTKALTSENAQIVKENSKDLAKEMLVVYDLVKVYEAQNSLFEEDILTEEGINKEVKLKESVTLEKINLVSKEIKANSQSVQLEEETAEVLAFAETQLTTKEAVDDWLNKNKKKYSKKNYQGLQALVEQVVPQKVQKNYQSSLNSFKKGLDKKIAEEKAAKKQAALEAEKATNQVTQVAANNSVGKSTNNGSGSSSSSNKSQATGNQTTGNQANSNTTSKVEVAQAPAPRTDGFNFKGHHFDLSSFSGVGAVPQWTPYIYQWSDDLSHYLVEKASNAGSAIWNIGVGDTVVISGQTYTVFNMMRHVPNDENAYGVLKSQGATVTWQTCETASSNSDLAIWYAY